MKKPYTFHLTAQVIDKIRETAKKERRSLNQMVDWILEQFTQTQKKENENL